MTDDKYGREIVSYLFIASAIASKQIGDSFSITRMIIICYIFILPKTVYIIWDNSNIHYGGLNQVFPIKEPGQQKELYRTHFLNLLNLVAGNREIGQVYFVGSTPPETDSIWAYLRSVGIKPETIPRSTTGGENNTTDYLLQNHLLRLGYLPEKGTIALLSGDGAGIYKNEGFFADLKKLHNVGWNIEVYAWDETCHRGMKEFAEQNWNFTNLTDSYYHITFLQGVRAAI